MDAMSIIIGLLGLGLGALSIFLCVAFYLKPLIDKSLTMLNTLLQTMGEMKDTMKEQNDQLKKLNEKVSENTSDHIGIVEGLKRLKSEIVLEVTDNVVERMKEIIK